MRTEPSPTVIVARRVRAGRDADAADWLRRLRAEAARAPGHVESNTQPPNEQHPDEWVTVYRFASTAQLDDWLESPVRSALLAEGDDLLDGATREQVVALPDDSTSVTAIASFRVRPGQGPAFLELYRELQGVLTGFEGFIRTELVEPVAGTQEETVIVFSFTDRRRLDRWLESPQRSELLVRIDPLLDGGRTVNIVGGFAGWFRSPEAVAPPTWKQAALVLLALYPSALVLGEIRERVLPDLNTPIAVLVGNVAGVAILSWVLMPVLTRLFDGWLRR